VNGLSANKTAKNPILQQKSYLFQKRLAGSAKKNFSIFQNFQELSD